MVTHLYHTVTYLYHMVTHLYHMVTYLYVLNISEFTLICEIYSLALLQIMLATLL